MRKKILVADDDHGIRALLSALLRRAGHDFDVAHDGADAVARLRRSAFDAVVLDLMMPVVNGFEVLQFLKAERPAMLPKVIVVTAASNLTLRDFDASEIYALVRKPFDVDSLMKTIAACCARSSSVEQRPLGRSPSEGVDA